jgi:hypothetical protein
VPTPFPNDLAGGHTWAKRDQCATKLGLEIIGPFLLQLLFDLDSENVGAFFLVRPRIR